MAITSPSVSVIGKTLAKPGCLNSGKNISQRIVGRDSVFQPRQICKPVLLRFTKLFYGYPVVGSKTDASSVG